MFTLHKYMKIGAFLIAVCFLLLLVLPAMREDHPALLDHVRVMKEEYPALDKVEYRYAYGGFWVEIYVRAMEGTEEIKEDLQIFLSSEAFLSEFLPLSEERMGWGESSFGYMPPYPDISIDCFLSGETESQWQSSARYYTQPYRSDRILEVDGYQTWYDEYYR